MIQSGQYQLSDNEKLNIVCFLILKYLEWMVQFFISYYVPKVFTII